MKSDAKRGHFTLCRVLRVKQYTLRSNNEKTIWINMTYLTNGVIMLRRRQCCIGKYQTLDKGKVVYADIIKSHPIL